MLSKRKIILSVSLVLIFVLSVSVIVFFNLRPAQNQLVLVRDIDIEELSNN